MIHQAGRSINHSFGDPNSYRDFRQLLLDGSETGDRLAERDPLLRILNRVVQSSLCAAHRAGAQLGPADVQNIECDVMPLADFTDEVVDGDHCILEYECAC